MFAAIREGITTDAEGEVAALTVEEKQMLQHRRAVGISLIQLFVLLMLAVLII
jgi:hypothetical protein